MWVLWVVTLNLQYFVPITCVIIDGQHIWLKHDIWEFLGLQPSTVLCSDCRSPKHITVCTFSCHRSGKMRRPQFLMVSALFGCIWNTLLSSGEQQCFLFFQFLYVESFSCYLLHFMKNVTGVLSNLNSYFCTMMTLDISMLQYKSKCIGYKVLFSYISWLVFLF